MPSDASWAHSPGQGQGGIGQVSEVPCRWGYITPGHRHPACCVQFFPVQMVPRFGNNHQAPKCYRECQVPFTRPRRAGEGGTVARDPYRLSRSGLCHS